MQLEPGAAPHMSYSAAGYANGGSDRFHFPDGNASIARLLVRLDRKRFGRITIANSDSGATAYTDVAIDQAYRAVNELLTA